MKIYNFWRKNKNFSKYYCLHVSQFCCLKKKIQKLSLNFCQNRVPMLIFWQQQQLPWYIWVENSWTYPLPPFLCHLRTWSIRCNLMVHNPSNNECRLHILYCCFVVFLKIIFLKNILNFIKHIYVRLDFAWTVNKNWIKIKLRKVIW